MAGAYPSYFQGRKVKIMSVSQISGSSAASYAAEVSRAAGGSKTTGSEKTDESKKTYTGGRTVGNPKLSEKAAKYYEDLKKKYGDMDFVLVSKDKMAEVKANAAAYGSPNKTVVLIDEEKIERMANDEEYRKKYEGLIENGRKDLKSMAEKLGGNSSIKGFGMHVGDNGTVSYFAAMEKGNADMNAKLAEKREAKKAAAKQAEKKAHKKAAEEKLKEKRAEKSNENFKPDEVETVSANSVDELLQKISDMDFAKRADSVMTAEELQKGGSIDFKG